jgi:hypothetical protein
MASPIQPFYNGSVVSEWFDAVTEYPTAMMPFKAPASAYEVSLNGYPAPINGAYLGLGLTGSTLLNSNLETSASVWLVIRPKAAFDSINIIYELRTDGMSGPVLASGETFTEGFNRIVIRYDPVAKTVSASLNETELGVFPLSIPTPRFIGFEGVAVVDNFVVRTLN